MNIEPNFFARIFSPFCHNYYLCLLDDYEIKFNELQKDSNFSLLEINKVDHLEGLIWSRLVIKLQNKKSIMLSGISNYQAEEVKAFIDNKKTSLKKKLEKIERFTEEILSNGNFLKDAQDGLLWISEYKKNEILKNIKAFQELLKYSFEQIPLRKKVVSSLKILRRFDQNPEGFKDSCNEIFVPLELEKYKVFFDKIEHNPLSEEQRKAIITDEDSTLVVASAGSGKTSLLVGKVSYLIKKEFANENQILVLAFQRNSRAEITERLKKINIECETHTFHSFGLKVNAKAKKKKSSTANFIENNQLYYRFIQNRIEKLIIDSSESNEVRKFFISHFRPYQDKFNFETLGEYYKFIKTNNLVTLKGEYVKSLEELEISNFLFANGIPYKYEQNYEKVTASSERRQYKPDFYLPNNNIYIEHFALDRNNRTPNFIDQNEYLNGVEWKRKLHQQNRTDLLETYSYQKREGNLTKNLEEKLRARGVNFNPLSPDELFFRLNENGYISELAKLCATFLNLFKGKNEGFKMLYKSLTQDEDIQNERILVFLHLFQEVFKEYELELERLKEIDFHDMINEANKLILNENCYTDFKYVLVDEFQDISFGRAKLIKSLQAAHPSLKLLAVGDDWQSIYRFTGSDIGLMTNFNSFFGYSKKLFLTKTYRFNSSIEKVASKFIRKNPAQIDKEVTTHEVSEIPKIKLFLPEKKSGKFLEKIVKDISSDCLKNSKILFLGRNNHSEEGIDYNSLKQIAPELIFEFRTVHSAKGYEADYVIVLDLKKARSGFPNEIVDDPIINIMLSEDVGFDNAEERRLFYVALTRAKQQIYLIADPSSPSTFFTELAKGDDYFVEKINVGTQYKRVCPLCKTSPLMERTSTNGKIFFGCQNYPLCKYTSNPCRNCNIGYLEKEEDNFICDNELCKHRASICPRCKEGYLYQRSGTYGLFLGCSNFYTNNCKFTKNI
jgi:DNA helicase IV